MKYSIEQSSLTGIANAIRNKNHESAMMTPAQMVTKINALEVEDNYEWRKPSEWPDLESITLPNSWEESTIYCLYDRSCGVDAVGLYFDGLVSSVYRGTVNNGVFTGELVASNVIRFEDTLTQDYTVYKIVTSNRLNLYATRSVSWDPVASYSWSRQGLVWIYGEAPTAGNSMFGDTNVSVLNPWLRRIAVLHLDNITSGFTFPDNSFRGAGPADISVSFAIGKNEYGDWSGITLRRTGNGPVTPPIKQKSDYIVKNVTFNNQIDRGEICARNVVLINPHGFLFQGQYCYSQYIEKVVVSGGDLKAKPDGMNYQFYFCYKLHTADLKGVDFSELTNAVDSFGRCYGLRNLRLNDTWEQNLYLDQSPLLTRESVLGLFDDLPTISTTRTLTLQRNAKERVTDAEIAVITQKGWTVA